MWDVGDGCAYSFMIRLRIQMRVCEFQVFSYEKSKYFCWFGKEERICTKMEWHLRWEQKKFQEYWKNVKKNKFKLIRHVQNVQTNVQKSHLCDNNIDKVYFMICTWIIWYLVGGWLGCGWVFVIFSFVYNIVCILFSIRSIYCMLLKYLYCFV